VVCGAQTNTLLALASVKSVLRPNGLPPTSLELLSSPEAALWAKLKPILGHSFSAETKRLFAPPLAAFSFSFSLFLFPLPSHSLAGLVHWSAKGQHWAKLAPQ